MSAPVRLAAFTAVLVLVFAAGLLLGRLVGPEPATTAPVHDHAVGTG